MEVILLQDIKSLGKKGDIVKVNDGYARNYILSKKLGLEANNKNLNDLKLQKAAEAKRQKEILEEARRLSEEIAAKEVVVSIKTGEGGRSFGSISTKEISASFKEQTGIDIDKKKLVLAEPIKSPGIFKVPVKLHPQVTGEIKVRVEEK